MELNASVIIPNYNRSRDVIKCVNSIQASTCPPKEIIVVDDCSTDDSVSQLRKLDIVVLENDENKGQGAGRNSGARIAAGEVLVFVDSDVVVYPDAIEKLMNRFEGDKTLSAVVGVPDKSSECHNLATTHFVMRVFHNYMKLPDYITNTNGTFLGVRREKFLGSGGFNEQVSGIEDSEFGLDISRQNGKVLLDKTILVQHNKCISFAGLIKNDMARTVDRVLYLFRRKLLKAAVKEKRFISTPMSQIVSALIAPLNFILPSLILFSPLFLLPTAVLWVVFCALNFDYLAFVKKDKGLMMAVRILLLLMVDMLFVHIALWAGAVKYVFGRRY